MFSFRSAPFDSIYSDGIHRIGLALEYMNTKIVSKLLKYGKWSSYWMLHSAFGQLVISRLCIDGRLLWSKIDFFFHIAREIRFEFATMLVYDFRSPFRALPTTEPLSIIPRAIGILLSHAMVLLILFCFPSHSNFSLLILLNWIRQIFCLPSVSCNTDGFLCVTNVLRSCMCLCVGGLGEYAHVFTGEKCVWRQNLYSEVIVNELRFWFTL